MSNPIFVVTKSDPQLTEVELDAGIIGPGWYFWDETWTNAHGPFSTKGEATEIFENYLKEVLDAETTSR